MESQTEKEILNAAETEFHKNGFSGARMQQIAERAGINKAMLHYYFRSKEKLFTQVFYRALSEVFPMIRSILESARPLEEKIEEFVNNYIKTMRNRPQLPLFIVNEINQNPERLSSFIEENEIGLPTKFIKQLYDEMETGRIREMDPKQLVVNVLSLCVFPFMGRKLIQTVLVMDEEEFEEFLTVRQKQLHTFILNALKP